MKTINNILVFLFISLSGIAQTNPVLYYPFNDNANDLTSNMYHGAVYNATLETDVCLNNNQSYRYEPDDGTYDYIEVPDYPLLRMSSAATFYMWVYPQGAGYWNVLDQNHSTGGIIINKEGEYEIARFHDGTIRWSFSNTDPGWNWHDTKYVVPQNQWTCIAITYNSGVVKTYINGELFDTYNGLGSIIDREPDQNTLRIGGRQGGSQNIEQYFDGKIDEVMIFNQTLSDTEIKELYLNFGGILPDFSVSPTELHAGQEVDFTDNSTIVQPFSITYDWNFGDEGNATEQNATYTFANQSNYTVTQTVKNCEIVNSISKTFSVGAPLNSNNSLSNLTVDGVTISGFSPSVTNYTLELEYGTTAIPSVGGAVADPTAQIVQQTQATNLSGDENERTASVVVEAQDGTQKTYSIVFNVLKNSDATLTDIQINGNSVVDYNSAISSFDPENTRYEAKMPYGTTEIPTITGVPTDAEATTDVNLPSALTGSEGARRGTVVVTAANGTTTKTYTVIFSVLPSNVSTLSNLLVNGVSIDGFLADKYTYTYNVEPNTQNIPNVTVVPAETGATVQITDATTLSGTDTDARTTTVLVTALDGVTTSEYSIFFATQQNTPPTIANQTFSVLEKSANGKRVGTVVANDADTDQTLSYSITEGNTTGTFAINEETGEITVASNAELDYTMHTEFVLTIQVQDTGEGNLTAQAIVTIQVVQDINPKFDNLFSPNDDGINDRWIIRDLNLCAENELFIYNNFGQLIFHISDYQQDWDGTYNGSELPVGTYYYVLKCGERYHKGAVTIMR